MVTIHLVQLCHSFLNKTHRPQHHLHFRWRAGMTLHWLPCRHKWNVRCVHGPNKLHPKFLCPARQPTPPTMSQCIVGFLNHFAYVRLLWTSNPNESVEGCNYFRWPQRFPICYTFLSNTVPDHFSRSWLAEFTEIDYSHCMWHPEGRICKHLSVKMTHGICIIFEVRVAWNSPWQLPLSAELLWSLHVIFGSCTFWLQDSHLDNSH